MELKVTTDIFEFERLSSLHLIYIKTRYRYCTKLTITVKMPFKEKKSPSKFFFLTVYNSKVNFCNNAEESS